MARVNHKKIKQLIAQKQKTITDRQFFASRALAAYFEDIAAAQTRRYGYRRRVKVSIVWKPKESGRPGMSRSAGCSAMSWGMYSILTFSPLRPITGFKRAGSGTRSRRRCAAAGIGMRKRNILSCFSLTPNAGKCWALSVMTS